MILYRVVDNLDTSKLSSNYNIDLDDISFALADYLVKLKYNIMLLLKTGHKYSINKLMSVTNHLSIIIFKSNSKTEPIYLDRVYYNISSKKLTYNTSLECPSVYPDILYLIKEIDKLVVDLVDDNNNKLEDRDRPVNKTSPKLPEIVKKEQDEKIDSKIKIKQEKEDEKKNIFKVDKEVYYKLKEEGIDGTDEDKIPILFIDKYPVFKFLDTNNLLDKEQEYELYTDLYNKLIGLDDNIQDKLNSNQEHEIFF